ncbi:hypothetical protein ACNKHT_27490 [Shigella flexneri]
MRTDWRGYAVLPYARISGNQSSAGYQDPGDNVDLDNAVVNVVPPVGRSCDKSLKRALG